MRVMKMSTRPGYLEIPKFMLYFVGIRLYIPNTKEATQTLFIIISSLKMKHFLFLISFSR